MRKAALIVLAVVALPCLAAAQGQGDRHGWMYAFAGAGFLSDGGPAAFNAGGGGELLVGRGLGFGGELGYLGHSGVDGVGLASVDLSYHFAGRDARRKLVPFVSGGGSVAFRSRGNAGGGNFGGGVQYWLRDRVAVRLEFRDFIFSSDSPHTFLFRAGVAFR